MVGLEVFIAMKVSRTRRLRIASKDGGRALLRGEGPISIVPALVFIPFQFRESERQ